MDLMSDFNKEKWENKGVPKTDYKSLKALGYASYNIFRRVPSEGPEDESMRYYLTDDAGIPCTGALYGADRDPLKSIGHSKMRVKIVKDTHIITGLIVEDDYVEIKDSFLSTIKVPEPEKKENGAVDLSMIGDLDPEKWTNKGQAPKMKSTIGYNFYNIVREAPETESGGLKYYLSTDEGVLLQAYLYGSKRDPLKSIGNCFFKISKENGKDVIKGLIVDDDWAEMK